VLVVQLQGYRLKLLVYRDGRVRCYGPLEGATLALKRMTMRVLGVDESGEEGGTEGPVGRAAPHRQRRR
jgi:hypothetical protein